MRILLLSFISIFTLGLTAQINSNQYPFSQLGPELPTPNSYRTASGAPGVDYWQQQADYVMDIELDDDNQRIYGEETITYFNNSPDVLSYLWIQLDQNMRAKDSDTHKISTQNVNERMSMRQLQGLDPSFDGGFKLEYVKDTKGNDLTHFVNQTMMRIDLPDDLKTGESFSFKIKWIIHVVP